MSLKTRLGLRVALVLLLVGALMFVPAGSFQFWQGWVFLAMLAVMNTVFVIYFYGRDQALLERRLRNKEPRREQKRFKIFWLPLWLGTLVVPGLDYRLGWSALLIGEVPVWLTGFSCIVVVASWLLVFHVMRHNSFASAVIQVETGQRVITDGPYRVVRHPMYTGIVLMGLATPLALGSWVALVPAVLLVPALIFRLLDEERALREELPGYTDYCEHTRFRLIPSVF